MSYFSQENNLEETKSSSVDESDSIDLLFIYTEELLLTKHLIQRLAPDNRRAHFVKPESHY